MRAKLRNVGASAWILIMAVVLLFAAEASASAGTFAVLYRIDIVDLGQARDLDALYDGKNSSPTGSGGVQIVAGPEALRICEGLAYRKCGEWDLTANKSQISGWLLVLEGATSQLTSTILYCGSATLRNESLSVRLTPLHVDMASGRATTEITVERIGDKLHLAESEIETLPGERRIVAAVRQSWTHSERRSIFGGEPATEYRDFGFFLTAMPVNVEDYLASSSLILTANCCELDQLWSRAIEDAGRTIAKPAGDKDNGWLYLGAKLDKGQPLHVTPDIELGLPVGDGGTVRLRFGGAEAFSLAFEKPIELVSGVSLEVAGGTDVGPSGMPAVMLGVADVVHAGNGITLFAKWYLVGLVLEENTPWGVGPWEVAAQLHAGPFSVSTGIAGDSTLRRLELQSELAIGIGVSVVAGWAHADNGTCAQLGIAAYFR